jgi:uncharacterized protein YjbI with pentapeptide repeats
MTGFRLKLRVSEEDIAGTPVVVDVVDQDLRLVAEQTVLVGEPQPFDLPAGNYGVRILLPSGRSLTDVVMAGQGIVTTHVVDLSELSPHGWMERTVLLKPPLFGRPGDLDQPWYESAWLRLWTRSEGRWRVELWPALEALREPDGARCWFHTRHQQQMLQLGGPHISWRVVALPPAERLEVTIRPSGDGSAPGLTVTVATDRNEAEALLGYLTVGALDHARLVSQQTETLLLGTGSDPAGAAVGGYYLLRVSDLERLHNWSANLANWTGWMPDGAVIHAWQLIREHQQMLTRSVDVLDIARARLLEAVERGIPVYTEGLRLLISGLKLMDFEADGQDTDVRDALDRIQPYSQAADLGQPTTTFTGSSPSSPSVSPLYGTPQAGNHLPLRQLTAWDTNAAETQAIADEDMTAPTSGSGGSPPLQSSPDLSGAHLHARDLVGLTLSKANLRGADLTGADLTGADLTGARLTRANLYGANLTRADLTGAYLTRADLSRTDLIGAKLNGANLFGADLTGAKLTGTELSDAELPGARMTGADLTDADLTGADLTDADLTRADLTRANLGGAYMTRARLGGARLFDADLTGADLGDADLTEVLWSGETLWPENMASPMRDRSEKLRPGIWRVVRPGTADAEVENPLPVDRGHVV